MIARLEENPLTDALILLVYDDRKHCKKMMRIPAGTSEESLLFYTWFFIAQILPGEVKKGSLLDMGNMMLRALAEGGE